MIPSDEPSLTPSVVPSQIPSFLPSLPPSMVPSVVPSVIPSDMPSLVPSISQEPSAYPTHFPTAIFSLQRTATFAVEIGIKGLDNLQVICSGVGAFLKQGIKDVYGPDTVSVVTCSQELNQGLRHLVGADNIFRDAVVDYEKPVLFKVTTTFDNYKTAPRQYGFTNFLEQLIVSDKAQRELPKYIQNAVGGLVFIDGVHVRLVFTPKEEPMLILGFGDDSPTPSPTATFGLVGDNMTGDDGQRGSSSGVLGGLQVRQSFVVCTLIWGIMSMLL